MLASDDQTALLIVALIFIPIVFIFAWQMNRRANTLLRHIHEREPDLWNEFGAPGSIQEAVKDPQRRWMQFIRSKSYKSRCHPELVAKIDSFRAISNGGLVLMGIVSLVILYYFWPLLKQSFYKILHEICCRVCCENKDGEVFMIYIKCMIFVLLTGLLVSCADQQNHNGEHKHVNEYMHQSSIEDLSKAFEDEKRQLWQKPDEVIDMLGDIENKTIIDIGAVPAISRSGYPPGVRMLSPQTLMTGSRNLSRHKKGESAFAGLHIELRKVPYDSPGLHLGEVHAAITVNTYHHIDHRIEYLKKVLNGLKPGGKMMVVDYQKKEFEDEPHGPPLKMRLDHQQVIKELQAAGFSNIELNESLLQYQYVIIAHK